MIILLFFLNHFYIKHFKLAFYESIWNIHKCVYCMKSTSINLPWRRSLMFTQWKCTLILIILILFMGHCIILWKILFVCEFFYETNAYPAWPLTPWPLSQVSLGESLLEAETVENLDTPVNCFRKLFGINSSSLYCFIFVLYAFSLSKVWESCICCSSELLLSSLSVCDVLPLILNNPEMCLPVSLLYKYMHKAAEFYICYVTREPSADGQMQGKSLFVFFCN